MRLIITGGLGHIGSGILNSISKIKNLKQVLIIDNLMSNKTNVLFDLKKMKNTKFIFFNQDMNKINFDKIFKKNDIVIHLGAITNATESFKIRKELFNNNYLSTIKIYKSSLKKNIRCIFFSSTSVYGTNHKIMFEDNYNNLNPQSPYAECKLKEEKFINKNANSRKKNMIILRLGTIFGISKGMRFHTAVNKFCFQAATNKPLTIWRTAYNQKRPYLDLNDAIKCIKFVIKNNIFDNNTYNVATCNITPKTLIKKIKKYKKIKIKFVKNKIMNQLSFEVNCDKIRKTGFKFDGNLNDQIKKTLNLFGAIN